VPQFVSAALLSAGLLLTVIAAASAQGGEVTIVDNAYQPPILNVNRGEVVIWTNEGQARHTVTSDDDGATFDSGELAPGSVFGNQFDEPGTYAYHCAIHPAMQGTVIVADAPTQPPDTGPPPPQGTLPPGFEPPPGFSSPEPTPQASPDPDAAGADALPVGALVVLLAVAAIIALGLLYFVRRSRSRP
jgi:plastocyanin